ncbi:unnamed protein product [Rotaria sp. Silwood1]|nr:unnamed protein product [Rotaria sp. Silwood1]CAF5108115.1 unnamed protein product [Rotaria sp. Silwood1]
MVTKGQITSSVTEGDPIGSFILDNIRPLETTKPYSWYYDQTHDNPCQIERRSVEDVLPYSAIFAFANCSTGSNRGLIDKILIEASLNHPLNEESIKSFVKSIQYINGLQRTKVYLNENISIENSSLIRLTSLNSIDYNAFRTIEFTENFRPGSIVILTISPILNIEKSIIFIKNILKAFENSTKQSDGNGFDVYSISNYGKLTYCSLQGQISILDKIRFNNDLKHSFIIHLKQGNWLMDYISIRLKIHSNTKQLGEWYDIFNHIKNLSRLIISSYFDLILNKSYKLIKEHSLTLMNQFIHSSSIFAQDLSQSLIQLISIVRNARLPLLLPNLREPKPIEQIDEQTFEKIQLTPPLAAGLPHFAAGI